MGGGGGGGGGATTTGVAAVPGLADVATLPGDLAPSPPTGGALGGQPATPSNTPNNSPYIRGLHTMFAIAPLSTGDKSPPSAYHTRNHGDTLRVCRRTAMDARDRKEATRTIIRAIRTADERARARHSWMSRESQDSVGLAIFFGAFCFLALVAWGWAAGVLPTLLTIVLLAMGLSILHELEHDLIHDLYYPSRPVIQHLMFAGIWWAKMSLNPWSRGRIHRYHHRVSGQPHDIEERLIGLGLAWGPKRLFLSLFPAGSVLQAPSIAHAVRTAIAEGAPRPELDHRISQIPARIVDGIFVVMPFVALPMAVLGSDIATWISVLWVLPNTIRHFSIVVISSNSHYTQIPPGELFPQNQVLNHWSTWPLQLFCFNFGSTHILHHYVVKQPFYIRQAIWKDVVSVLRENGVPFNDLQTFRRANRWLGTSSP